MMPAHRLRRLVPLLLTAMALQFIAIGAAAATTLDVCPSGCPYRQLAPAIAAAESGDTIRIGPGTYAGGLTIDVSLKIVGAGVGRTIIRGGGPVVTIGTFGASTQPTVSMQGVTITGGVTRSSPVSTPFVDREGVIALGGGVAIPPNADFTGGATVTITDSAITGNRVAPARTLPIGPPCPDGPCPFAQAGGGGIDSWGTLTLRRTTVRDNHAGSASKLSTVASDAQGGAITSWLGTLTIDHSVIAANTASATGRNGRFAEGGGIFITGGALKLTNSSLRDNHAVLAASLPDTVDLLAQSGGIFVSSDVAHARIVHTSISGNSATMTNTAGASNAFAGGINVDVDVDFRLRDAVIADNRVRSATLRGSQGDAAGDDGGGLMQGTVTNTRITGNTVTVSSVAGDAFATTGGVMHFGSLTNSTVRDNHVRASSPRGTASVIGGGLMVAEHTLTLRNTTVSGNTAHARGRRGIGRGGGIYNGPTPFDVEGAPLILRNSRVTGNVVTGSPGVTLEGGGIYALNQPVTLTNSVIADNLPDQCHGC